MSLSFLVYDRRFAPLDHWHRVLPDAHPCEVSKFQTAPQKGSLLWLSADVPDWQTLCQRWSDTGSRVLLLTRLPDPTEMNRALACGARAYLPALANARVMRQAAEIVGSGGLWFPEELLGSLLRLVSGALDQTGHPGTEADLSMLTAREHEVARYAAKGESNRAIAQSLGITERTVKEHMGAVFRKLGVKDRMQLMLLVTGQRPAGGGENVR
ncbi:helix-turn-helix transcriptional regulator [Marinobacter sp. F3R08]|uniref:helix-turn-helix transcriptional regulator n=1 Tax=Marinobacter sp. F3R08 TaxID=2841559 RepID=UPI001C08253C|nr:response regulator transcription factor [Marinobacter sp. F3R08]MBU2953325.1 response regulator transcription factor [Marinobacter sp. F3R08]